MVKLYWEELEMKIKDGFMLREIAGQSVVVPLGQRVVEFNGIITLSESGAYLWKKLEKETSENELVEFVTGEYSVDAETAKNDIKEFIESMKFKKLLD
jgi:hypothetical protein